MSPPTLASKLSQPRKFSCERLTFPSPPLVVPTLTLITVIRKVTVVYYTNGRSAWTLTPSQVRYHGRTLAVQQGQRKGSVRSLPYASHRTRCPYTQPSLPISQLVPFPSQSQSQGSSSSSINQSIASLPQAAINVKFFLHVSSG